MPKSEQVDNTCLIEKYKKFFPNDNRSSGSVTAPTSEFYWTDPPYFPNTCPCCGRCPHCGRGGYYENPHYQCPYPYIICNVSSTQSQG